GMPAFLRQSQPLGPSAPPPRRVASARLPRAKGQHPKPDRADSNRSTKARETPARPPWPPAHGRSSRDAISDWRQHRPEPGPSARPPNEGFHEPASWSCFSEKHLTTRKYPHPFSRTPRACVGPANNARLRRLAKRSYGNGKSLNSNGTAYVRVFHS